MKPGQKQQQQQHIERESFCAKGKHELGDKEGGGP